jgi:hypothetical protein
MKRDCIWFCVADRATLKCRICILSAHMVHTKPACTRVATLTQLHAGNGQVYGPAWPATCLNFDDWFGCHQRPPMTTPSDTILRSPIRCSPTTST